MSALQTEVPTPPRWAVEYVEDAPASVLAQPDVLAVFGFGQAAPRHQDPRYLRIALEPARTGGAGSLARSRPGDPRPRRRHRLGARRGAAVRRDRTRRSRRPRRRRRHRARHRNGLPAHHRFPRHTRLSARAADVELLRRHHRRRRRRRALSPLLRRPRARPRRDRSDRVAGRHRDRPGHRWERAGRRRDATPAGVLAGRAHAGHAVENPRQVSAYRYPRQYGPQPPRFARAMLPPAGARCR